MRVVSVVSSDQVALHQALADDLAVDDELDPRRELLGAERLRRDAHRDVVVAATRRPSPGRVVADQRRDLDAAVGEVLDGGRDLADEQHLGSLRRPHPQRGVGDAARHRRAHHRRKSSAMSSGSAMMSTVPSSADAMPRSSLTSQSVADAAAVALEHALGRHAHRGRAPRALRLVLPSVSRMAWRCVASTCRTASAAALSQRADRRATRRGRGARTASLACAASVVAQPGPSPGRRVDQLAPVVAGDDREPRAVDDLVDGRRRGLARRGDLGVRRRPSSPTCRR